MNKIAKPLIVEKQKDGRYKLKSGAIITKEELDKLERLMPHEALIILIDYPKKDFNAETGDSEKYGKSR